MAVRLSDGRCARLTITNVRCVPDFNYTLLSVSQLWEEQGVDSQFANKRCLRVPPPGGTIPFATGIKLPTVKLLCTAGEGPTGEKPAGTSVADVYGNERE